MNNQVPNNYFRDHAGKKYGLMTVISFDHYKNRNSYWLCECECGNRKVANVHNLKTGQANSCGCLKSKNRIGKGLPSHYVKCKSLFTTYSKTDEYRLWTRIKFRCYNSNYEYFHLYGGRGIKVCDEWLNNPVLFIEWAKANGYKKGLLIDRIDVNGNYEPNNCRFVNDKESSRNTRKNLVAELFGIKMLFIEWCEVYGLHYQNVYTRFIFKQGISPSEAILQAIIFPEPKLYISKEHLQAAKDNILSVKETIVQRFIHNSFIQKS